MTHDFIDFNSRKLTFATLFAGLMITCTGHTQTAYISDELTVPLRSGPSNGHRIIHAGLPSGTNFEVIDRDEDAGYTQIRTERGTLAWIRSQYLTFEPIAKQRLAEAQTQLEEMQVRLDEILAANETMTAENFRISMLEEELAEIRSVSASAIETHEENKQLKETNTRLRDELDDLAEAHARVEDNEQNQALMIGAGLIFLGLIAGVLIKARPQRSAWS